jgi:hypothetical protein
MREPKSGLKAPKQTCEVAHILRLEQGEKRRDFEAKMGFFQ